MKFGEDWSKRELVTPIFDHLVQFWIMSVPKQPPLKLKSACQAKSQFGRGQCGISWKQKHTRDLWEIMVELGRIAAEVSNMKISEDT